MANILDKLFDKWFKSTKEERTKAAFNAMEKDPEYQKAKKKVEDSVEDAKDFLKTLKEKYNQK